MKVAVLGYGTVGSGVVEVLTTNSESIKKKAGTSLEVKYILDLKDFNDHPLQDKFVKDINIILNDEEIDIVAEAMGGTNPAYTFVKEVLLRGKSVVTSNKELVAAYGPELLELAKINNCNFLFEASVGGGIPIIRPLNQSLTADEIEEITGILNGTTNYILTKMSNEGLDFDTVLKDAQEKGYAERNPEADVEGYDACRKIAILSSLAFGMQVDYEDIYTEGITKITDTDIKYAKAIGASIKLFGTSRKDEDKVFACVTPVMINNSHPLYSVNDVFNGIYVRGNVLGDVMFYGSGAGKLPTASAVMADVIDAVKHLGTNIMTIWSSKKLELADFNKASFKYFVRVQGDTDEVKKEVARLFGEIKPVVAEGVTGEFAFITMEMKESEFNQLAEQMGNVVSRIRVRF